MRSKEEERSFKTPDREARFTDPRRIPEADLKKLNITDLAKMLNKKRKELEAADERATALQIQFDQLRIDVIPAAMAKAGIESVRVAGVGNVIIEEDMWTHVPSARREDLHTWMGEHNLEDLITETINSSTLKAWIKERKEAKGELPPGDVVVITPYRRASIRK